MDFQILKLEENLIFNKLLVKIKQQIILCKEKNYLVYNYNKIINKILNKIHLIYSNKIKNKSKSYLSNYFNNN